MGDYKSTDWTEYKYVCRPCCLWWKGYAEHASCLLCNRAVVGIVAQEPTDDEWEVLENDLFEEEMDRVFGVVDKKCLHVWIGSGVPGGQMWCKRCNVNYNEDEHGRQTKVDS